MPPVATVARSVKGRALTVVKRRRSAEAQSSYKNSSRTLLLIVSIFMCIVEPGFSAEQIYEIQAGDTLYSIARRYGIDHELIMQRNNIVNERSLRIGQEIIIPQVTWQLGSRADTATENYEIQGGDTIYSISRRTGMSVQDILDFNNLDQDDIIRPGQVLQLHNNARSPSEAASRISSGGANTSTQVSSNTTTQTTQNSLRWPLEGEREKLEGKFPGVIIPGQQGDSIRAVSSGRVVYSGPHSTLANVVFVQNGRGYIYIYGGNSELQVATGDEVQVGQVIGDLGPSALLPNSQVYFSVWKDGKYVDPETAAR